ncbi:hypothetical protein B5S31_g736 [[Candida] boidinii]|nr:hypothetical protein B5S31_g736 [[Candida] boidinii]
MTTNFNSLSEEVKKLSSNKSLNTTLDQSNSFLDLLKNYKSDLEKLKQNSNSNKDLKTKPLISLKKEFKNYQDESNKNIKSLNSSIRKYNSKIDKLFTFDIDDIYRDPIDIKGKKTDYSTEFEVPIRNSDNLERQIQIQNQQQQLLPNTNNRNNISFLQNIENSSVNKHDDKDDNDSDPMDGYDDNDENNEINKKNQYKEQLINRSIIMHLLRVGLFEIVKEIEIEKNLKVPNDLILKFLELNKISNSLIKDHDLKLAIEWSKLNDNKLRAIGSDLEFNLLKLQFSKLLDESNINNIESNDESRDNLNESTDNNNVKFKAYNYAKENFPAFGNTHLSMISKVFSNLVLNILDDNDGNEIDQDQYEKMDENENENDNDKKRQKKNINDIIINKKANNFEKFDDLNIQKRYNQLCQDYCSLIGLSSKSSLFTTLLTGYISLPSYIKFNQIFKNTKGKLDWTTKNELPFEIELPESLQFHSIFICPVSKEETTSINPPMVLPCNHIISNESLNKLSNNMKSAFKCPYCPSTSVAGQSRKVKFITV